MRLIIGKIGHSHIIGYAFDELARCVKLMDGGIFIEGREYDSYDASVGGVLWLGLTGAVAPSVDDAILIDVKDGAGIVTGSNERSVLIACYKLLYRLGCRWLRPGDDGESIPKRTLNDSDLNVYLAEKASYRHRAVCIEGAVGYEHVYNVINWLPKVGMNGYYVQFRIPYCFFSRWHNHDGNPTLPKEPLDESDVCHIWKRLEEEIAKRGLLYHAVGHGWTCEPFGIGGTGWDTNNGEIAADTKKYFAEVNGVRELCGNIALNTNLCYSNPEVRERITDSIVGYCKDNPAIDYLHFWLADHSNNHCECPECRKLRPSDYYVLMLNELDKKLTAAGIPTKIVFLIYVDLLWEPEVYRIENPDRFVLMFAPITRTYTKAFCDFNAADTPELAPYVRNKLKMPRSVGENVARLSRWQEQFDGDSFDFDYHMMWDHALDPGYYECARILHRDMANLDKIGLNGMVSCQVQRASFPTGLPMYAMARALWDKESDFEAIADEYFTAAFGADGDSVREYMRSLSELFDPPYLRGEKPAVNTESAEKFAQAKLLAERFGAAIPNGSASWNYLAYHAEMCILLADCLRLRASGCQNEAEAKFGELERYVQENELKLHSVLDVWNYIRTLKKRICTR